MTDFLKRLLLLVISLLAAFFLSPAFGQEGQSPLPSAAGPEIPAMAPLNPAFVNHVNIVRPLDIQSVTTDGHGLGFIPPPVDRSYLTGQSISLMQPLAALAALPSSYDLRDYGKVSLVRNQLSCGDCWAFATMGSLESNLLTAETWDFSENNLKNTSGFDWGPCDGGNGDMSTAYLARWDGPVRETDDPYSPNPPYTSPAGLQEQKHIQEVLILPPRANSLDNNDIKQTLMDYGGVWTSYYASGNYYSRSCPTGTCTTYYYSGAAVSNHAVTIVGWDDDFPKTSFTPEAPGNGAFIIKNSWGTGWGVNGGFFYISYYDSKLGYDGSYVYNGAEPITNYSRVYQYDPLGLTVSMWYGSGSSITGWFSNIFTAAANELLSAVSFYTASTGSSYEIYVYTGVASDPRSGALAASTTGSTAFPGYHTVTLPSSPSIATGQKFSVVVKLTTPGYNYPIPLEYPIANYSSAATASAGQSYVSSNGTNWADVTSFYANTNVCLKAFTALDTTPPTDGTISAIPADEQVALSWSGFSDSGGSGLKSSNTYKIVRRTGGNPSAQCTSGTQVYLGNGTSATDTGLTNGTTYYYRVCAYDNAGNISSGATDVATLPVRITVTSSPAGMEFSVDGPPYTTAQIFTWTPGSSHSLGVTSPQSGVAGTRYVFSAWSDGGAQNHTITPTADMAYNASFTTQYQLTTVTSPTSGGTIGPDCTSGCWYNSGASEGLLARPNDGYVFNGWSGDCSEMSPSTSVVMGAAENCTANFSPCGENPAQNQRTTTTYTSLGDAYGDTTGDTTPGTDTRDGDTISLLATTFDEILDLSRDISVVLRGGYECGFVGPASYSVITGPLTIRSGKVTFDCIIIR